jgi:hypothetical protein
VTRGQRIAHLRLWCAAAAALAAIMGASLIARGVTQHNVARAMLEGPR